MFSMEHLVENEEFQCATYSIVEPSRIVDPPRIHPGSTQDPAYGIEKTPYSIIYNLYYYHSAPRLFFVFSVGAEFQCCKKI